MARIAQKMIRESLDAFVREDTELALNVCKGDNEVDQLNAQIFRETLTYMIEDGQTISRATKISSVSNILSASPITLQTSLKWWSIWSKAKASAI
jgi:phosphate transport system protein